jgi:DNA repair exonuclease SbcCD ATPase subunit
VDAVKAEHNKLLEDAFERAKVIINPSPSILASTHIIFQNEAGEAHGQDLQKLRAESQATMEQLRTAHQSTIDDMKNEHTNLLDSQVKALEKQINNQTLELKATQDDLAKAKAALEASRAEVESLKGQLDEAKAAALVEPPPDPALVAEIEGLTRELANAKDDVAATHDALNLTKQSLSQVTDNHTKELEEAAKGRAEEVIRLKAAHEEEVSTLVEQKSELATKLSDLEGELATLKAAAAAEPPSSPKTNGTNGITQPSSPGVTKEELQSMHEAHNAKVHDLQAEHDKALKAFKESLEASQSKAKELQEEVSRKTMEIQYLEQEQEESADQITRYVFGFKTLSFRDRRIDNGPLTLSLKEDMGSLSEELKAKEATATA